MRIVSSKTHYDHVKKTPLGHPPISFAKLSHGIQSTPFQRHENRGLARSATTVLASYSIGTKVLLIQNACISANRTTSGQAYLRETVTCQTPMLDTFDNSFVRWKIA
jgi:hypothetical protein